MKLIKVEYFMEFYGINLILRSAQDRATRQATRCAQFWERIDRGPAEEGTAADNAGIQFHKYARPNRKRTPNSI